MRFCYCSTLLHWNFFCPPRLPLLLLLHPRGCVKTTAVARVIAFGVALRRYVEKESSLLPSSYLRVRKTPCRRHFMLKTPSFCQDRLGTDIGKPLKKKFLSFFAATRHGRTTLSRTNSTSQCTLMTLRVHTTASSSTRRPSCGIIPCVAGPFQQTVSKPFLQSRFFAAVS